MRVSIYTVSHDKQYLALVTDPFRRAGKFNNSFVAIFLPGLPAKEF